MSAANILVVEDDTGVRALLHLLLERNGYAVTEATTADDAIRAIAESHVDLVLLDLVLGHGKTGLDVLRIIRSHADTAALPVLVLTGSIITQRDEDIIRDGGAYVFYKPAKTKEIMKYVARLARPH